MNARAFARRALRAFAPLVAMVVVVTVGLAFASTAIPRSVDAILTDALRYDAGSSSAISRDVLTQTDGNVTGGPGDDTGMSEGASAFWGLLDGQLEDLRQSQPRPLRDALGRADYAVVTTPSPVSTTLPNTASLGYDPRFLARVTIVEGDAPVRGPASAPSDRPIEVIASQPVAEAFGWSVGETYTMYAADAMTQPITLVGIFEANDPDDQYWQHTTVTLRPAIDGRNLPPATTATVFADAAGVSAVMRGTSPFTTRGSIWYPVSPETLDASTAGELAQQLRKFASAPQQVSATGQGALLFRSDLPDLLEDAIARSASSQALLATILAGPIGLAVAIEVLVARLAAARLRDTLLLLRARGASVTQRRLLLGLPALLAGAAASAVGVALAVLLPGGELGTGGIVAVVAVAVAPAVLLVLFGAGREAAAPTAGGLARLVGETLIVLAAVASVGSALQRGNGANSGASVDILAAAVPLTLSLLGCILTLRVYPVVLRRLLASAHHARGIAPFLGIARALRAGSAGLVPVLAVVIGVSVAVFSGVLASTLVAGTQSAAQTRVGADISVDGVRLDEAGVEAVRDIDGVAAAAGISTDLFHRLTPQNGNQFPVTLVLVDPQQLAAAQNGAPGALALPDLAAQGDGVVPLAVSAGVAAVAAGETAAKLDYDDVELLPSGFASEIFNTSQNWVVGDIANAEALDFPSPVVADQILVRLSPGASVDRVKARIVDLVGPDAVLVTPSDVAATRSANPAVGGIRTATVLAIIGAALLTASALALTTLLDGRGRRASLSLLASIGLGRRQARRTVVWELAPLSAVGLGVGLVLGAVLAVVVLATVNLRPFTAGIDQPAATVDPWTLLAVVGGFALLLAATVTVAAWRAARPARTGSSTDQGWDS